MWSRMNYKKIILPISILIVIDQVVKLLIKKYLFDIQIVFIEGIIGFYPKINTNQTWGGNYISILANPIVANILVLCCFFIIITGYQFYRSKSTKESLPAKLIFIFLMIFNFPLYPSKQSFSLYVNGVSIQKFISAILYILFIDPSLYIEKKSCQMT